MSVYRTLNYPINFPDTNKVAANCHAKFNWGSFPYMDEWDVATSGGRTPSITLSLYVTIVESRVAH